MAQTPDGELLGLPPVLATTAVISDGLAFSGTLQLGFAPTPRGLLIAAEYLDDEGDVQAVARQPGQVIGRFARVPYLIVEAPLPLSVVDGDLILVRGAAPGPPKSILVRLLDAQEQVLATVPAMLGWYQPGLATDWTATVPKLAGGVTIQVVSLGENDAVIEEERVPLGQPAP